MISREEAIHILEIELKAERFVRKCFDEDQNSKVAEALEMAIEDMQKLTPKPVQGEPLNHDVKINNCTFRKGTRILAICPSCGEWVNKHHKHCSECGQAIDWSEKE